LSSIPIHFCRGMAESDSASQSEKKSGGQIFEHLAIPSRVMPRGGLQTIDSGEKADGLLAAPIANQTMAVIMIVICLLP
jgi:hypothetical protein